MSLPRLETRVFDRSPVSSVLFNSHMAKVARNGHGVMTSHTPVGALDAVQAVITLWSPDLDRHQVVYSRTGNYNPPVVIAAPGGAFYAIFSEYTLNQLTIAYWADVARSTIPVVTTISTPGNGKFAGCWDPVRNRVYFLGHSGIFYVISAAGLVLSALTLTVTANNHQMDYPFLQVTDDGAVHAFLLSITDASISYRTTTYAYSADGGASWRRPGSAALLPLPFVASETGPALCLMPENLLDNKFMYAAHVDANYLHIMFSKAPGFRTRLFANLPYVTGVYRRFSRSTGQMVLEDTSLRGAKAGSGCFFERGASLYLALPSPEDGRVYLHRSAAGAGWEEIGRFAVPGVNPDRDLLHYLNIERGSIYGNEVVATLMRATMSPAQWSDSSPVPNLHYQALFCKFRLAP